MNENYFLQNTLEFEANKTMVYEKTLRKIKNILNEKCGIISNAIVVAMINEVLND